MDSPHLDVRDSLGQRVVPLDKPTFSIGRRSASDLHLLDTDVSRDHAEIVQSDGGYVLRDRGSRYGTFVNGTQVTEQPLNHGDRIAFGRGGRTELVFLLNEASSSQHSGSWSGGDLRQIASLLETLRGLGGGRVLDEVLTLVLDSAIEITGAERGFIMLASATGSLDLKIARAEGKMTLPVAGFATSRKIPEEVFATGKQKIVADLGDSEMLNMHEGTIALGIRHVLCTPLRLVRYLEQADADATAKNIGVLYLDSRSKGKLLAPGARAALETLASEAALAIENARLYRETLEKARIDQELRTAAQIQQALLPPPRKKGAFFEAMGSSVPCRAVGGDFFEYMDLPEGGFGFALGDVAGKGPPAALLTAVLQGIMAGQAQSNLVPSETMRRINVALLSRGIESRFATAFLGHLTADGQLTYTNAGHNPPFVFSAGGVRRLEAGGMIVGLFPNAEYEQETVQLSPGDIVVIFSDGVSEAASESGEEFGDSRIESTVGRIRTAPCDQILTTLLDVVRDFTKGTAQGDDITAVVVRFGTEK
jgi:phosphoserine phosphatase RsbU/P